MNEKGYRALIIEEPYFTKPSILKEINSSDKNFSSSQILESTLNNTEDILETLEIISESYSPVSKSGKVQFRAIVQESSEINKNGRYYPPEVLQEAVNYFKSEIARRGGLPAEVDHPFVESSDPQVIKKRASQIFIKEVGVLYKNIEFDGKRVIVEGVTLDNPKGQMVYSLIKEGYNVGFSLRAFGKVVPINENGQSYLLVEKLDRPLTWDVVINPSHQSARLVEIQEGEILTDTSQLTLLTESDESINNNNSPIIIPGSIVLPSNNPQSDPDISNDEDLSNYVQNILNSQDVIKIEVNINGDTTTVCVNGQYCQQFDTAEFLQNAIISYLNKIQNEIIPQTSQGIFQGTINPVNFLNAPPGFCWRKALQYYYQNPDIDDDDEFDNEDGITDSVETFINELIFEKFDYDIDAIENILEFFNQKFEKIDFSKFNPYYLDEVFILGMDLSEDETRRLFFTEDEDLKLSQIELDLIKEYVTDDYIEYDEEEPEEFYEDTEEDLKELIDKKIEEEFAHSFVKEMEELFEKMYFESDENKKEKISEIISENLEKYINYVPIEKIIPEEEKAFFEFEEFVPEIAARFSTTGI
jgi:hypothetical protein